ncbi:scarecrow-like protein 32 [Rhodamnia argentea]|uniref:Scarecrow-like protein 32 n=1 Tax=Rhodamnia argentea TaxID=178133 RepID=A0A8B8QCI6_9MYRT|nr:scarecrow-like protein 32 [Rhodamnia argentea]
MMKAELRGNATASIYLQNLSLFNTQQSSLSGALKGCLGSLDAACIEKLLLHCASALERSDVTLAQQVMWVLNNVASSTGDPNQRLTSWFLKALISRASRLCPTTVNFNGNGIVERRLMSVTELAVYVDLIPWHRFGFCASNSAIYRAIQGYSRVHILDFSITHCMQWPTLIDALAKRPEGPPSLKITVPSCRPPVPPLLNVTIEEIGLRLGNFAKFRDVPFEFAVLDDSTNVSESTNAFHFESILTQLSSLDLNLADDEALVINCQNWVRYLCDEPNGGDSQDVSLRDVFLDIIKGLDPNIVIVADEDVDLSEPSLASRITTCFNYLWIPFDALETFLPKDSCQRLEYESDVGHKIENIVSFEGFQRMERLESGNKLAQRMRNAGFLSLPFCEETVTEVKSLLDEHASGWGMKREEDTLVLTWKGHNSVFATAWVPSNGCEN